MLKKCGLCHCSNNTQKFTGIGLCLQSKIFFVLKILIFFYCSISSSTVDNMFSNVQNQLTQMTTQQECEAAIRQSADFRHFINACNEFDKPIYAYKPLNGMENLKLISNFYEDLLNAMNTLRSHLRSRTQPSASYLSTAFWHKLLKLLFPSSQQDKLQFENLNVEDLNRVIGLIEECDSILRDFYKSHSVSM